MRRSFILVFAVLSLAACNTVEPGRDSGSFAALSNGQGQAEPSAGGRKAKGKSSVHKDAGRYFIEFRSRVRPELRS
jgi:hypothetical protein